MPPLTSSTPPLSIQPVPQQVPYFHQPYDEYQFWLKQLDDINILYPNKYPLLIPLLKQVKQQAKKEDSSESELPILNDILKKTYALLTGQISTNAYQDYARSPAIPGNPSNRWLHQFFGGIMKGLGAVMFSLGASVAVIGILSGFVPAIVGGAVLAGAGAGLFYTGSVISSGGKQHGLSEKMNRLSSNELEPLKPHQVEHEVKMK